MSNSHARPHREHLKISFGERYAIKKKQGRHNNAKITC